MLSSYSMELSRVAIIEYRASRTILTLLLTKAKYQTNKPTIMINGIPIPKIHFSGEDFFLTLAPVIGASGVILLAPLKILVVFTLLSKFGLVASAGDVELAAEGGLAVGDARGR